MAAVHHPEFYQAVSEDFYDEKFIPHLVYADWLDEQGDPRGEFIRVQCEMEVAEGERYTELKKSERELLQAHSEEWQQELREKCAPILQEAGGEISDIVFVRGFPIPMIWMPLSSFLEHGDRLRTVAPVILLAFKDKRLSADDLERLAESENLDFVN